MTVGVELLDLLRTTGGTLVALAVGNGGCTAVVLGALLLLLLVVVLTSQGCGIDEMLC